MKHRTISQAGGFRALAKASLTGVILAAIAPFFIVSLRAVERVWQTGGVNSLWSTPSNWNPVGAPVNGDSLRFAGVTGETTRNDLNGLIVARLSFNSDNWRITGNTLTVTNGVGVGPHTGISVPFNITIQAPVNLATTLVITLDLSSELDLQGQVSGSGGLSKNGPGTLVLQSSNTFTGQVFVGEGNIEARNGLALGTRDAGTTVSNGATLSFSSGAGFVGEPLTIAGSGSQGTNGALRSTLDIFITNNVVLNGPATIRTEGTNSRIQIQGVISGTGPLTKVGSGVFGFRGNTDNTYSGETIVLAGEVLLSKPLNVASVPRHLIIGGGGGIFGTSATVRHANHIQIRGSVTVNRGGLLDLNGFSEFFLNAQFEGRPPLTLNGGGRVQTGTGLLVLPEGGDVVVDPGGFPGASSSISGRLELGPGPHRFIVDNGVTIIGFDVPELDVPATITQSSCTPACPADIVKEGPGEMRLSSSNSFTGPITVNQGGLTAAHASALGTTAAGTFVNNNASLALDGGISVNDESLTLNSTNAAALISLGPVTNVWSGNLILQRTAGINVSDARGTLTHSGIPGFGTPAPNISGPGGFNKSGPGALFVTGLTGGNSYTGPTTVNDGLLEATRAGRSLSSDIVVVGATSTLRTGRASANQFNSVRTVLPTGASVTVQDGGLWVMTATNIETLSCLTGNGRVDFGSGAVLSVSNSTPCTFSGTLSGSALGTDNLVKQGPGTMHVTGDSAFGGSIGVTGGVFRIDGSWPNAHVHVRAGQLRGGGRVGPLTTDIVSLISPDSKFPGHLGGELEVASFSLDGTMEVTFFGPSPHGGNDVLVVLTGDADLDNPQLSAHFGYAPRQGDVITIIRKLSPGPTDFSDPFVGWPDGTTQPIDGIPMTISYFGGDGNDVTLTVTNLPLQNGGSQLVAGNGGGALVPNDCSSLWLVVTNRSATTVSNVHGTLRSLTSGVLVTRAESDFPNLPANVRGTNATPFQIRTEPSFPCGGLVQLELVLTTSNLQPTAILYTFLGSAGRALGFNGSGNYVAVPHTTALNAFPLTVTMWVKTSQSGAGLVTKYVSSSLNGWSVFLRSGHVRAWYFRDSANYVWDGGDGLDGGFVADGRWHHVAFTVTVDNIIGNSGGRIFVDGLLKDSRAWGGSRQPQPGPPTTTQEVRLGNEAGAGIVFNGLLDEISVWRAALSPTQIQTNMHRALTGAEANLLAYYRCDEESGATVGDSAPLDGNNNGTWIGTPLFVLSDVLPFSVPGGVDCNSGGGACESCVVVSGQFTTNALASTRGLEFESEPSICDPPKPCPGFFEPTNSPPVRHVLHGFTNNTPQELCVTVQLRLCAGVDPHDFEDFGVAAYLGEFLPNQPCSNYLGDSGEADTIYPPFSFRVPPLTNFLLVVSTRKTNLVCDTYALELFGLPCPPPRLDIAHDATPGKVRVSWSSAYPDYSLQSVNSLDGPGPHGFGNISTAVLVGGKFAITNDVSTPRQFFRLAK